MQRSHLGDDSWTPLGQRRGISDLARSALSLDLHWVRADAESAARQRSYPSPPMSGSPSIPPKLSQEAAERAQGSYQPTTQDVYRGIPTTQGHERGQVGSATGPSRQFLTDPPERAAYSFQYAGRSTPQAQALPYTQLPGQISGQPGPAYLPIPGTGSTVGPSGQPAASQTYPPALHPQMQDPLQHNSPKARKTKGHVASACVPCKKAHLRLVALSKLVGTA
ncbi:hypothetical protein QBC40DRAFT_328351 [Triangularia verruculosa]|uniref:Uncharacterized protein n=1 Tax=Triangularia verruculosa TaxID=2587418 RepID=A0AAN7AUC5_9PEZI|nr:hypothetical protein QBC40DRAFT_328351 [Triangularia verruculosa]